MSARRHYSNIFMTNQDSNKRDFISKWIWSLLRPEEIGVQLTEGFMMDPEASVSALVFQHPDCTYFSVGESEE